MATITDFTERYSAGVITTQSMKEAHDIVDAWLASTPIDHYPESVRTGTDCGLSYCRWYDSDGQCLISICDD